MQKNGKQIKKFSTICFNTKGLTNFICLLVTTIVDRNLGKGQFGNLEADANW